MLPEGTVIDVTENQELWAPDVFKSGDTYYSYYSVSHSGLQISDIGVATSTTCEPGSWTDHGSVGVPKFLGEDGYNLIDANFFRECDTCDNLWNFGSAWQGVFQTSLNDDLLSWSGETPSQKVHNSTIPPNQTFEAIAEGGFLFWWPVNDKKYYYMFFSSGACCNAADKLAAPGDEYKIMVCRAESPTGPFFDQSGRNCASENGGTLVLGSHGEHVYAPGGQGVLVDGDRIVLYYHYGKFPRVLV
jgi:arabinan endo-1,5-alpha-L-arabinosidase